MGYDCRPRSWAEVLQGTLDSLVLKTIDSMGPIDGFGIAMRIQQVSEDLLRSALPRAGGVAMHLPGKID